MAETYYMTAMQNAERDRALRQRMAQEAQLFQEEQAAKAEDKKLGLGAIKAFAKMQVQPEDGPQPPPPGQPSVPMIPPPPGAGPPAPAPQAAMGRMAPPPGPGFASPPPAAAAAAAPAAQAAGSGAPKPINGPPGGAPPPGQPLPWKPMPPPPAPATAAPGGIPPPPGAAAGGKPDVLPPQWLSIPKAIEAMDKAGVPEAKQYETLSKMMPMINAQNKQAVDELGFQVKLSKALNDTLKTEIAKFRAEKEGTTPAMKEAAALYGKDTPEYKAAIKKNLDKMNAPSATTINMQQGGESDLAKDDKTRRFMAEQYWAGDSTVMQNLGRGAQGARNITALRQEIVRVGEEMGKTPKDLAAAVAEFQGMKAGERTLGTRTANIEMAGTEADMLADLALKASGEWNRTGIKTLNDLEKYAQGKTANPELRRFVAANTSFINAYARAINPQGVGTVADKEHAREMLEVGFAKKDYAAAIDQLKSEIGVAKEAPGKVKESMRKGFTGADKGGIPAGWKVTEH